MIRLLGLTDDQRLELEQTTGIKTEGVKLLLETSMQQAEQIAQDLISTSIKEVQEVIGPHGSVTRLQAGGIKISQGMGISVYEDGVLKTTIEADGDLLVGSNIEDPATTTLCAFVNDQIYNNEEMGAGDLLIGDNTLATSNVKYDASEGQLQFRYGTIVQAYMDTDGSIVAGRGAIRLDQDGMTVEEGGDAISFSDSIYVQHAELAFRTYLDASFSKLEQYVYQLNAETNLISNGDFASGDLTSWTETDPGSAISVEKVDGNYAVKFADTSTSSEFLTQNLSLTASNGMVVTLRVKADGTSTIYAGSTTDLQGLSITGSGEWRNLTFIIESSCTNFKLYAVGGNVYIDDILVRALLVAASAPHVMSISISPQAIMLHKQVYVGRSLISINNETADVDTTIRGDTASFLFYVDAGLDAVQVGEGLNKGTIADFRNTAIVLNESGADRDTRIEGDTDTHLIFADASADKVGIGDSTPSYKLDVNGDVNVASGSIYRINGTQLGASNIPVADAGTYFAGTDVETILQELGKLDLTPGGRLTLTTATPVTTSDVTGATTIYYTPYVNNRIRLWDGTQWVSVVFTEKSLALGTMTAALCYDVFGYLSSGDLALEKLAWTSATARATAITLQDGRYCKSGDKTRLYLGTFYTTSTTATEDSRGATASQTGGKRFLWNMYNRVRRSIVVYDDTNSWSYTTATIRQANGAAGNKVEFVIGVAGDMVYADVRGTVFLKNNVNNVAQTACGLDTTSAFSGLVQGGYWNGATDFYSQVGGSYMNSPAVGYHYISWNEKGADGTSTFVGDNGGNGVQSGMNVEIWA